LIVQLFFLKKCARISLHTKNHIEVNYYHGLPPKRQSLVLSITMILSTIIIILFVTYSIPIIYYWWGWKDIPLFIIPEKKFQVKISVIIPARNEEANIGNLLSALQEQTYSKDMFEVIVIDDNSSDRTVDIIKKFPDTRLIQLRDETVNSFKKKAIETGIGIAKNELIVTTDADCIPPENWLETIAAFKEEKGSVFIAAPVTFNNNSSLLQIFQSLDFLVLQGITGASVHKKIHPMSNGANLAYEKNIFLEVNGFSGIDNIASGDDMLLMNKITKKYPDRVHYLKSKKAIVTTQPMQSWKEFFSQRTRWASKVFYYKEPKIFFVLLFVYLFNFSFLFLLAAGFVDHRYWIWLVAMWVAKTIIEFPLVRSVAVFFNRESLLKYFFFFQPLHIFYTLIAGLLGQTGKYEWKGRKVK